MRVSQDLRRAGITLCILGHFVALSLNNLPFPVSERLHPFHAWYAIATGQRQGWRMYAFPSHEDSRYDVTARWPDGKEGHPVGVQADWDPRFLYFIEALFLRPTGPAMASDYLTILCHLHPEPARARDIVIRRFSRPIADRSGWAAGAQAPFLRENEFSKPCRQPRHP
jgi:hypothetical protein